MDKALDDIIKENNHGLGKFMRRNRGDPQRRNNNRDRNIRGNDRNQKINSRGGNFPRRQREKFEDTRRPRPARNPNYGMMIDRELTVPRSYRRNNDEPRNDRNGGHRPLRNARRNYGFNHDPSKVGSNNNILPIIEKGKPCSKKLEGRPTK